MTTDTPLPDPQSADPQHADPQPADPQPPDPQPPEPHPAGPPIMNDFAAAAVLIGVAVLLILAALLPVFLGLDAKKSAVLAGCAVAVASAGKLLAPVEGVSRRVHGWIDSIVVSASLLALAWGITGIGGALAGMLQVSK
ncbi:hypothetical protein [Microbacterium sp. LMI1x-1-1.1]|uniref:hypothetical protein n=1 Tax=Microbacterium sp. LMI1x-1-1.1 TaxID=3135246 RepID=UPI00343FCB19